MAGVDRETPVAAWDALWLLGPELLAQRGAALAEAGDRSDRLDDAPDAAPRLATWLDEGFFRAERGRLLLFGDFSTFGATPAFSGHNHCDISSFLLWYDGRPVAIDAGTFTYRRARQDRGVPWRVYLRSAPAHNVASIEGVPIARPPDEFGFDTWPEARLLFAQQTELGTIAAGEHLAYEEAAGRAVRVFVIDDTRVAVIDWFPDSGRQQTYTFSVLLAPEGATLDADRVRWDGGTLRWTGSAPVEGQLVRGAVDPPGGWRSPSCGTIEETPQSFDVLGGAD
jgi:hypothetical protein